ncbi:MAG: toxic anion resistance protein [Lachnospiraceae bacterium]|nr:toxic anion resistance protein [Lachnospiraceae bacterium]
MAEEFMAQEAPTLVFDAAPAATQTQEAPAEAATDGPALAGAELTEAEKKQVESFVDQIDIQNSTAIMNYGAGTQKKMADFSEKALESVRTKDMGEVGDMVTNLVTQLKNFDVDEEAKGLKALFKKSANRVTSLKARYSSVETNVNTITSTLEKHQVTLMKDVDMLDKMYDQNLAYYKELTMYILAGKEKLEQVRNGELKELQEKAEKSGLPEDAQAAKDLAAMCDRFEKKIYDLELTKTISMQTAPQIRMVQSSDTMMAEKIQSTIVNTIPLWKSQMVIALGVEHSTEAAKAQREVSEMTNELLKKNADKLKTATIEATRESERGIVDMETLKHTNETLISTLDEVLKIQTEGKEKRRTAEAELAGMETELKKKLLEVSKQA